MNNVKILSISALLLIAPAAATPKYPFSSTNQAAVSGCITSSEKLFPQTITTAELTCTSENGFACSQKKVLKKTEDPEIMNFLREDFMNQCVTRRLG